MSQRFEPADADRWNSTRVPWRHAGVWRLGPDRIPLPLHIASWPNSRSYTGEPLLELHLVGSPPLLDLLLEDLFEAGARPARPGEFTLRAFLAGRIDLLQAEGVIAVIDAQDEQTLQQALVQLAGGLSTHLGDLRNDLLNLLADVEAGLDFTDEGLEFVPPAVARQRLQSARDELGRLLAQSEQRMLAHSRPRVVLAGLPNVGKSTLFNVLTAQNLALVSAEAGTTRDWLRADLTWEGVPLELIDTAGWDDEAEPVLRAALDLRQELLQQADLIVWCQDAQNTAANPLPNTHPDFHTPSTRTHPVLNIHTRADLAPNPAFELPVSAQTGLGLHELRQVIVARISGQAGGDSDLAGMTAARCRDSLQTACTSLDAALNVLQQQAGDELLALELHAALDALGHITGAIYTDDILDRIFSRFCIGK